jgi:hypothetical protein
MSTISIFQIPINMDSYMDEGAAKLALGAFDYDVDTAV